MNSLNFNTTCCIFSFLFKERAGLIDILSFGLTCKKFNNYQKKYLDEDFILQYKIIKKNEEIFEIKNKEFNICENYLYLDYIDLDVVPNLNIPKLKELHLDCNSFEELPNFRYLTELKSLRATENFMEVFPELKIPTLNELNLSSNRIKIIPQFNLNITELNLAYNEIEFFPENILKIKYLNLSYNNIKLIPKINLPNLKELNLNNNQIEEFNICAPNLKVLDLCNNEIKDLKFINECFSGDSNLKLLFLTNNEITELIEFDCKKLKSLYLDYNKITDLNIIPNLPELKELILCNNNIETIDKSTEIIILKNLKKIKEFNLRGNLIKKIPKELAEFIKL